MGHRIEKQKQKRKDRELRRYRLKYPRGSYWLYGDVYSTSVVKVDAVEDLWNGFGSCNIRIRFCEVKGTPFLGAVSAAVADRKWKKVPKLLKILWEL